MMHGPEKSDLAIVAGKLTNKAERSAAELVEQGAGTKGNARQPSTPHLPDAGRKQQCRSGQTRDLPAFRCDPFARGSIPTPCNRCVRFATAVASGHATLATKRTLLLTWARLAPAGSHQLAAGALTRSPRRP